MSFGNLAQLVGLNVVRSVYTRYRPEVTENTSDEFVARTDFFRYIFRTPVFGHLLPVTSDTGSISPLSRPYS